MKAEIEKVSSLLGDTAKLGNFDIAQISGVDVIRAYSYKSAYSKFHLDFTEPVKKAMKESGLILVPDQSSPPNLHSTYKSIVQRFITKEGLEKLKQNFRDSIKGQELEIEDFQKGVKTPVINIVHYKDILYQSRMFLKSFGSRKWINLREALLERFVS